MMEPYPCIKCGSCCRSIDRSDIYSDLDNGHGICIYFNQNTSQCNIYENRPEKCRINEMYKYFKESMSYEEYIKLNIEGCKSLRRENECHYHLFLQDLQLRLVQQEL